MGMTNIQADKIEEFLSLFSGDASEASSVLFKYAARQKESITSTGNLHNKSDLEEIISVEGVSKRYKLGKNTIDALKDVSILSPQDTAEIKAGSGIEQSFKQNFSHPENIDDLDDYDEEQEQADDTEIEPMNIRLNVAGSGTALAWPVKVALSIVDVSIFSAGVLASASNSA